MKNRTERFLLFLFNSLFKHDDKYDYSKVNFVDTRHKVTIVCYKHGEFVQRPSHHTSGTGCNECFQESQRSDTNSFIEDSKEIHGETYNYSKVIYKNYHSKVDIVCSKHGIFKQSPAKHLSGQGCMRCAGNDKKNIGWFIENSNKKHKNYYDYKNTSYKGIDTKVEIICPEHGTFFQAPYEHIKGSGCPDCGGTKKKTTEKFIKESVEIHGKTYNYSKVVYINCLTKVIIICKKHGEFNQTPNKHLFGQGCRKCAGYLKLDTKEFIKRSIKKHGDKYIYTKVRYKNSDSKVTIICKKHGEFHQVAWSHLNGIGCIHCNESHGEKSIVKFLEYNKIQFDREKKFDGCSHKRKLSFDFYIPSLNMCIEYDGLQHFVPISTWGGRKNFLLTKKRDKIKNEYCKNAGIKLIRISYKQDVDKTLKKSF